jgi:hypothetical protein
MLVIGTGALEGHGGDAARKRRGSFGGALPSVGTLLADHGVSSAAALVAAAGAAPSDAAGKNRRRSFGN